MAPWCTSDGNINVQEARYKEQLSSASKGKSRGLTSSTTEVYRHKHDYDVAEASNLDVDKINIHSTKGNITIQGSNVAAGNGLTVKAKKYWYSWGWEPSLLWWLLQQKKDLERLEVVLA